MVDGGKGWYSDRPTEEPPVSTRCVLAHQWQH
jgi:hypothetical protein